MYRKQEEKVRSRLQEEPIWEVILDKKAERTSAIGFADLLRSFAANLTYDILPSSVPLSSESHPYLLLSFLLTAFASSPYATPGQVRVLCMQW